MSVEGVNGIFCVSGPKICIAAISDGNCPPVQNGLPNGSYCGQVASGVYGCKTIRTPAPPATTPAPPTLPPPAVTPGPVINPMPAPAPGPAPATRCATGFEMSIEGVAGIFCVAQGPVCLADRATGTCPGPQPGLPNGSSCGRVASGVFGCKINSGSSPVVPAPAPAPAPAPFPVPAPAPVTATPAGVCSNGGSLMSIEGVPMIFYVMEPACVQQRSTGNCPGPQIGLPYGSRCDLITKTGVYGCKPHASASLRG